ncbi:MAG: CDP-alcohol phosphatidyltransferase family protein, partial [Thermoanaerobaculia bacterium]
KILISAAFIALVELNLAPAWMVVVILAREFAVSTLRSLAASENMVLGAIFSAKVKTVCQIVAISLLIFYNQLDQFEHLAPISLWLALLASIYSGVEYFVRYAPLILQGRSTDEG